MHPAEIQAALKMRDYTQVELAAEVVGRNGRGVTPTSVYQVIQGRARSKGIELRIAAIIDRPLAEIWPQWYGAAASHSARPDSRTISRRMAALARAAG